VEEPLRLRHLPLLAAEGQLVPARGDAEVELRLEGAKMLVVLAQQSEEIG
jgi:hypothetical protein